jgi:hypothetical protein
MFVTPYVLDSYQHLNLGTTTYDIHDIVGDTISLTQDDPDKTEIPWEFGDDPLDTNVKAGAKNFTCQCLDFQDAILQTMFGCTMQNGATIFPTGYQDLYVYIRIVFENFDLVLPYVKMDAKTTLENMRTDIARGELAGTILSHEIITGNAPVSGQGTASGTPVEAPMLYVPKDKAVFVLGSGNAYKTDYRGSASATNVTVTLTSPSNGTVEGLESGANTVPQGAFLTLTAVPAEGYHFSKWTINGEDISSETVGFIASESMTVAVTFAQDA